MFNFLKFKRFFTCFLFLILLTANSSFLSAHEGESHAKKSLHFSHPLISESPSPDTKIRLDYFFMDVEGEHEEGEEEEGGGGFKDHTLRLEAEYAFSRNISIEVDVPYTFIDPDQGSGTDHFNNIEVGLKLATFIFEQYGLLLGGGIEFGIPTGDDKKGIGSDHIIEIEPFLSMGYKYNDFELVSFVSLGFPVNQDDGEDESDEFGYNVSLLYHLTDDIEALLEFDGEVALNGEEDGESVLNIDPGIKILPFKNKDIHIGFGAGFPLTEDEAFEYRLIGSLIYHF
jgi:hypothetical protein